MSLFNELKRRNVIKVAIAYAVVAWLLLQVADVILPTFRTPDWVMQAFTFLLILGFPVALIFAWAFELTPEGLKREHEVDRSQSITPDTGKKLNNLIFAVMALALGYFAYDKLVLSTARDAALVEATTQAVTEQVAIEQDESAQSGKSIAVLPFVNISDDPSKEYFSDGITEEIINALVKIPGLSVPARTSVFAFKGESRDVRGIGRELNVAHVLEGSIRSQNNQVRITAQLIKVDDGFHLWSETFDRELNDIFKVQEEIAASISEVLVGELGLSESAVPNQTLNMEAYDLYLQGRALLRMRGDEELIRAIALFEAATESDPDFAPAWAALAIAHQVTEYSLETGVNSQEKAIEVAQRALSLDPHNVDALDALASAKRDTWHWAEAEKYFERAMAIDPQSSELLEDYAEFLGTIGRLEEYLDIAEKGYSIDPLLPPLALSYVSALIANHRTADAIHVIDQRLSSADTQSPAMFGPFAQRKLRSLLVSGDTAAAIEFVNGMIPFQPEIAPAVSALLQNPGNKEARDILRSFSTVESGGPYWGRPGSIILVLAQSGDVDYVIDTEIALRKKIGWGNLEGFWISLYAPVRQHARFEEFLNFVNLPQYWDEAGWPELCQRIDDGRIVCQ